MSYEEIKQKVYSEIDSIENVGSSEETKPQSNEEILNMIALEIQRKGG